MYSLQEIQQGILSQQELLQWMYIRDFILNSTNRILSWMWHWVYQTMVSGLYLKRHGTVILQTFAVCLLKHILEAALCSLIELHVHFLLSPGIYQSNQFSFVTINFTECFSFICVSLRNDGTCNIGLQLWWFSIVYFDTTCIPALNKR